MTHSPAQGAARTGRRIGITLFWCMAVFIVVASSLSVIEEIYGRGASSAATGSEQAACAGALRALQGSLLDQAAMAVRTPQAPEQVHEWLSAWDRDYAAIGPCGDLEDARLTLGDLRARTAAMLEQHARRSAPLTERLERALDRLQPRPSSRPPKET